MAQSCHPSIQEAEAEAEGSEVPDQAKPHSEKVFHHNNTDGDSYHLGAGSGTANESVCELRLVCQVSGSCPHLSSAGHSQGDTRLRLRVLSVMEVGLREAI